MPTPDRTAAPRVVAVVPARGGSKGIPGKNLRVVGGVPLVVRTVRAALAAGTIDEVVVSTDDAAIANVARLAGARVVERPAALAGDEASSESAVLHALDTIRDAGMGAGPGAGSGTGAGTRAGPDAGDPVVTVFLQATSPFVDPLALDAAVGRVLAGEADVVFSAAPSHSFLWREGRSGAEGVNHEASVRLRRQDRAPEHRETGAFYVLRTAGLRETGHRFFGRVGIQSVPAEHAIEIDDEAELMLADALAATLDPGLGQRVGLGRTEAGVELAGLQIAVDAVVTDFDGVHTDDTVLVDAEGRELVRVSRSDGHGVRRLREAGIPMLILSAERNPVVSARAAKLRVDCLQGVDDKATALVDWADRIGVPLDRIAYLGNDLPDLPCLRLVGWPVAVADAAPEVRAAARLVLARVGGDGAVRALADLIVGAREHESRVREPHQHEKEGTCRCESVDR